jgi:hypothetical protein
MRIMLAAEKILCMLTQHGRMAHVLGWRMYNGVFESGARSAKLTFFRSGFKNVHKHSVELLHDQITGLLID